MNIELIKSLAWKIVPIVATFLVGKGIIDDVMAEKLPGMVDALIILAVTLPTLFRSLKTHKDGK
jgi:hypothetical protein